MAHLEHPPDFLDAIPLKADALVDDLVAVLVQLRRVMPRPGDELRVVAEHDRAVPDRAGDGEPAKLAEQSLHSYSYPRTPLPAPPAVTRSSRAPTSVWK